MGKSALETRYTARTVRSTLHRLAICGVALVMASSCKRAVEPPHETGHLASPPQGPQLMFVSVAGDDTFHRVAVASLAAPRRGSFITPLSCERVYFAGNRGICLITDAEGPTTKWWADIFNDKYERLHRLAL